MRRPVAYRLGVASGFHHRRLSARSRRDVSACSARQLNAGHIEMRGPGSRTAPPPAGTGRRHRHGMRLMHDRRHGTLAAAAIGGAGFSSRPAWSPFRCALRKRRRLTGSRATRRLSASFNRVFSRSRRTRSRSTRARRPSLVQARDAIAHSHAAGRRSDRWALARRAGSRACYARMSVSVQARRGNQIRMLEV